MSDRVEQLLRSALVPIEPPEALSDRLERGLSELTEVAAAELADWELSAMRDPRNWGRPIAAVVVGGVAAGSRRSATPPACRHSRSRFAAWRTTSRSACATSEHIRLAALRVGICG